MTKKLKGGDIFKGILFIFALAIIPLISKLKIVQVSEYEYGIIRSSGQVADIFSYNKSIAICVVAGILFFAWLMDFFIDEKKVNFKKPYYVFAGVFFLLNIISALFSPYKYIALNGISERYEGLWVILGYMVLFVSILIYTDNKSKTNVLLLGFALSGLFVGIVGALQYIGIDFFKSELGNRLVLGSSYVPGTNSLAIKFDSVYSTLYNPNCVGLFMGMMFPLSLIMAIALPIRNKLKYVFAASALVTLVCLIGSDSVGGLLGMLCAVAAVTIIALIYFIKKKIKTGIIVILVSIVAFVVCGVIFGLSNAKIKDKLNIIIEAVKNPDIISNPNFFEDMSIDGYTANIYTKMGTISIDFSQEVPVLYQNGRAVEAISEDKNIYNYEIDSLAGAKIEISDNNIFSFVASDEAGNNTSFLFGIYDGAITALDKFGTPVDISQPVVSFGFEGMERLGSNRGYIWSRSIPLLIENLIIGKGPDTFSLEFPQNDILGKLRYQGNPYIIVDKPHNMYLQMGINSGVISLIAFIGLIIIYFAGTVKAVFKSNNKSMAGIKLAVLGGVIGFLVAALTTDSVVSVTPVFWMLLGFGFAVNSVEQKALEE